MSSVHSLTDRGLEPVQFMRWNHFYDLDLTRILPYVLTNTCLDYADT